MIKFFSDYPSIFVSSGMNSSILQSLIIGCYHAFSKFQFVNLFSRQFYDFFCLKSIRLYAFEPELMSTARLRSLFLPYVFCGSGLGPSLMQVTLFWLLNFGCDSWWMLQMFQPHSQLMAWFRVQFPWVDVGASAHIRTVILWTMCL